MNPSAHPSGTGRLITALLLRRRDRPLTLWLIGTLLYGTVAGALLQQDPYVAGTVITAIWMTAAWSIVSAHRRRSGHMAVTADPASSGKVSSGTGE